MLVPFEVYVHVPFCARRCGYCDFNTYVAGPERHAAFVAHAIAEMELAAAELEGTPRASAQSVFFGGGTPTILPVEGLVELLEAVRRTFGVAPGGEVSAEANPDSVDAAYLEGLAAAGFTRVSFGMQSAVPWVLAALDRSHDPARLPDLVADARGAGLDVSVDLIYGTPGETLTDWEASVRAALDLGVDHVSAYALSLEEHTPMARRIRQGLLAPVDADEQAAKYVLADELFSSAGLGWYEISNWARPGHESMHNLGYWTGAEWWGIGPGAHSSLGARRFWNVKSPVAYADRLTGGASPVAGEETLDDAAVSLERIMLRSRTSQGLDLDDLSVEGRRTVPGLIADGLAQQRTGTANAKFVDGIVLTQRGRLLADLVTRTLAGW
ncbi:MAG: radical SAM family heme chaperone HemW [Bifidobacteriaceae bacterium]|nr:radical SAM family heme chaperone HemW [Bifidobacteriaceae bacterium]